jgi:arylsulfatase A-like enzyme
LAPDPAAGHGFLPSPLALGAWLGVFLVGAKTVHWGWPGTGDGSLGNWIRDVGVSTHEDVAFAAAWAFLTAVLLRAARRRPLLERALGALLLALGALFVLYAVVSVQVFAYLRSPLTYPLLYLAGDFAAMRSSIGTFVSPGYAAALVVAPLLYVVAVVLGSRRRPSRPAPFRVLFGTAGLAAIPVWVAWGVGTADGRWSDRPDPLIARNPHGTLLASLLDEARGGSVPRLDDAFPAEYLADFRPGPRRPSGLPSARPRNVLVVVLESTGAKYLGLYGSPYPTTPRLDAEARHALVFDSFYAHVGLTANSLVALGISVYPYMTWREYTQDYPRFPGETLANVLGPRGYRTAFLTSQFLDYVGLEDFLADRGFDEVRDWNDLSDAPPVGSWGGDDAVLVDRTLEWIDRAPKRPFFGLLWTQLSHHPYDPSPHQAVVDFFEGRPEPPDAWDLGRYLNTLAEVDRQLGRLFDGLRARGLADDTLVVVTGDHGECFGDPHPTWGHGFRLWDEGIRVPFMLWNPRLFGKGRRSATVGGHVDVSPTILDVLALAPPGSWEGRSLLAKDRPGRAYFYAANDEYLLGVREGPLKYVYNVTRGREALFDLSRDPDETTDVAARHPDACRVFRERLSAWKHHAAGTLEAARKRMAAERPTDAVPGRLRAP